MILCFFYGSKNYSDGPVKYFFLYRSFCDSDSENFFFFLFFFLYLVFLFVVVTGDSGKLWQIL